MEQKKKKKMTIQLYLDYQKVKTLSAAALIAFSCSSTARDRFDYEEHHIDSLVSLDEPGTDWLRKHLKTFQENDEIQKLKAATEQDITPFLDFYRDLPPGPGLYYPTIPAARENIMLRVISKDEDHYEFNRVWDDYKSYTTSEIASIYRHHLTNVSAVLGNNPKKYCIDKRPEHGGTYLSRKWSIPGYARSDDYVVKYLPPKSVEGGYFEKFTDKGFPLMYATECYTKMFKNMGIDYKGFAEASAEHDAFSESNEALLVSEEVIESVDRLGPGRLEEKDLKINGAMTLGQAHTWPRYKPPPYSNFRRGAAYEQIYWAPDSAVWYLQQWGPPIDTIVLPPILEPGLAPREFASVALKACAGAIELMEKNIAALQADIAYIQQIIDLASKNDVDYRGDSDEHDPQSGSTSPSFLAPGEYAAQNRLMRIKRLMYMVQGDNMNYKQAIINLESIYFSTMAAEITPKTPEASKAPEETEGEALSRLAREAAQQATQGR
ncbi:MAG: hypothetical protein JAY72_20515 [Candidatus Thiodiazotropha endolucinida]|nr:hypothetical protein [Candidatus Thiodiazotropha taylori]MCW4324066.1 hypothetical protein [Candidatus Thiodiazotropha taylori]